MNTSFKNLVYFELLSLTRVVIEFINKSNLAWTTGAFLLEPSHGAILPVKQYR